MVKQASAKRHARIILHGKAADDERVRDAVTAARDRGHQVEVRVTWEAGDAARLAAEAVADAEAGGLDTLIAGGGDGTLNEVVSGAIAAAPNPKCSFAVLPLGTANDFACAAGIPTDDMVAALALATDGRAAPMDLGALDDKVFVNFLSGGFGTKLTAETDPTLKKLMGGAAYLVSGLHRFSEISEIEGSFHGDGFDWQGRFAVLAIGNGRQAGGGIRLCPDAKADDGLLDVSIVPMLAGQDLAEGLMLLFDKGFDGIGDMAIKARVRSLTIESETPLHVNLDGEPTTRQSLNVRCLPNAIRFHFGATDLVGQRGMQPVLDATG